MSSINEMYTGNGQEEGDSLPLLSTAGFWTDIRRRRKRFFPAPRNLIHGYNFTSHVLYIPLVSQT
jgi:hypothetical protein